MEGDEYDVKNSVLDESGGAASMENLENESIDKLREMRAQIDAELKKRASKERQEARKKILDLAHTHAIDLSTLAGTGIEHRYENPENPFQTWTGRGRQPKWVQEQLAKGKSLQDLKIS
jgi:DNA-binding protein H-NS